VSDLAWLVVVGVAVLLTTRVIHHGYAWRGYQGARVAVRLARSAWLRRFAQLVGVLLGVALVLGALYVAGTPGR
jgi:hypothetical protein